MQKADEPTRGNVFVFHQNYTVILVTSIALRAVSKNNFPKARTEMHCGKVRA